MLWDIGRPLELSLQLIDFDHDDGKKVFWHSSAHVLGEACELKYGCHLCIHRPSRAATSVLRDADGYPRYPARLCTAKETRSVSRHGNDQLAKQMKEYEKLIEQFALKPMRQPWTLSLCLLFGHREPYYRRLPMQIAIFGALHRNETNLTRVRRFQQDDVHIF